MEAASILLGVCFHSRENVFSQLDRRVDLLEPASPAICLVPTSDRSSDDPSMYPIPCDPSKYYAAKAADHRKRRKRGHGTLPECQARRPKCDKALDADDQSKACVPSDAIYQAEGAVRREGVVDIARIRCPIPPRTAPAVEQEVTAIDEKHGRDPGCHQEYGCFRERYMTNNRHG